MEKSYDKSVDLFLFGLLVYEMLTGVPAFPFDSDHDEQQDRIIKCKFSFPGEEGCTVSEPLLSDEAKSLISGLLVPEGKKRLTVAKIKSSDLFGRYIESWQDVENGHLET